MGYSIRFEDCCSERTIIKVSYNLRPLYIVMYFLTNVLACSALSVCCRRARGRAKGREGKRKNKGILRNLSPFSARSLRHLIFYVVPQHELTELLEPVTSVCSQVSSW